MKKNILAKLSPFHFLMLLIAGIINAIGVTLFIAPVQLYDSGISGTSILLSQLTPDYLSLSFFLILLNIPLLLFGFKRQGAVFSIYAIFTVCVYSVAAWLITDVLPIDVSIASPLAGTDLFLCALFGGIISGVGSGLAIRYGGAMDGIEVVAVIFAKPLGLSVGTFVLIYNVLLYIICGIVMSSWILPLYSIVTYAAGSKTVDFIVDGLDSAKAAMIITTHPDEIARAVSEEFGTGLTIIDAHGFYSDTPKTVLYVVVNRFQTVKLKTLNLLPSVVAAQHAKRIGVQETVFHRGDIVTECAHSNVSILKDGVFYSHPNDEFILRGIAKTHMIQACYRLGITVIEKCFTLDDLRNADEIIVTSSSNFCLHACEVDGKPAGGKDPATLKAIQNEVLREYYAYTGKTTVVD